MKIVIEDRKVSNIPILDVYEAGAKEKRPVLIMLHGANGRKEKYIERAYDLVKKGFFVTLFDAYGHGELRNSNEEAEITNASKDSIDKLLRVYVETSKYVNSIIDSFGDNVYADTSRVTLMGVSMGAHTIYYHILKERNPRIKAAVTINGSPIWKSFVRRYISKSSTAAEGFNEVDILKIESYIESIEPLNFADNIKDFPLLILNGEKDELISINDVRQAYSILQDRYMNKELIKFIEFKGIGHTVTQEALESACKWLEKHI